MKGTVGMISALLLLYFAAPLSRAFIDDFDDGNLDGWKVQSGHWKVKDGELQYKGGTGICGASLYYEDGVEWTDYEFEVDIKLATRNDWPGGIRVRLNPDTGGSYFTWVYPGQAAIMVYIANAWDCNNNRGIAQRDAWEPPELDEWGKLKMVVEGRKIQSWWNGEEILSIEDKVWEKGTISFTTFTEDVYFDNVRVVGPGIPLDKSEAVEPEGKLTITWGKLKTSYS